MEINALKQEVQAVIEATNKTQRTTLAHNMLNKLYSECVDNLDKFHDFLDDLILDNDGVKVYVLIEKLAEKLGVKFVDMDIVLPYDKEEEYEVISSTDLADLIENARDTGYLEE